MKKVISLFLVMAMLTAMLTVSFNALSLSDEGALVAKDQLAKYEAETGEELETQRLYFQMPNGKTGGTADEDVYVHRQVSDPETGEIVDEYDELVIPAGEKAPSWYSEYNIMDGKHYAGVYWWTGPANAKEEYDWCGYRMEIEDYDQGIYYVDIPIDVTTCIFNNGVDGGTDDSKPIFNEAAQTVNVTTEGLDPGDPVLTYGTPKANDWLSDGCIAIINPNGVSINEYSNVQTCGYDWYVYYGNGCYGIEFGPGLSDDYPDGTPDWSENVADICRNPDHFKNGVHVGYQPDTPDDPTEAPTDAPTEKPTEAPTEAHIHTPGKPVEENRVEASCDKEGSYDEVVYCTECGEEISREHKTIEKTAHSLKFKPGRSASATADGYKSHFECKVCGKLFADAAGTREVQWEDIVVHYVTPTEKPTEKPTEAPTEKPTEKPSEYIGVIGDIDSSEEIDIVDVTVIQRVDLGIVTADAKMKALGDVNTDGSVDIIDATMVQRWLLDIPQTGADAIGQKKYS